MLQCRNRKRVRNCSRLLRLHCWTESAYWVSVYVGEPQKLAINIDTAENAVSSGKIILEPQTEGFSIAKQEKVQAMLKRGEGEKGMYFCSSSSRLTSTFPLEDCQSMDLDVSPSGEIVLPACEKHSKLVLYVVYEGAYTEFEYRVGAICRRFNQKFSVFTYWDIRSRRRYLIHLRIRNTSSLLPILYMLLFP